MVSRTKYRQYDVRYEAGRKALMRASSEFREHRLAIKRRSNRKWLLNPVSRSLLAEAQRKYRVGTTARNSFFRKAGRRAAAVWL